MPGHSRKKFTNRSVYRIAAQLKIPSDLSARAGVSAGGSGSESSSARQEREWVSRFPAFIAPFIAAVWASDINKTGGPAIN